MGFKFSVISFLWKAYLTCHCVVLKLEPTTTGTVLMWNKMVAHIKLEKIVVDDAV